MFIVRDTQLYAGWSSDDAKEFCKNNGLDKEKVRMVDREGQILVIARKDFEWK